jgi:hypothetical protein
MADLLFIIGFVQIVSKLSTYNPTEDAVMFFQTGDYPKAMLKGLEIFILTSLQVTVAELLLKIFKLLLY